MGAIYEKVAILAALGLFWSAVLFGAPMAGVFVLCTVSALSLSLLPVERLSFGAKVAYYGIGLVCSLGGFACVLVLRGVV